MAAASRPMCTSQFTWPDWFCRMAERKGSLTRRARWLERARKLPSLLRQDLSLRNGIYEFNGPQRVVPKFTIRGRTQSQSTPSTSTGIHSLRVITPSLEQQYPARIFRMPGRAVVSLSGDAQTIPPRSRRNRIRSAPGGTAAPPTQPAPAAMRPVCGRQVADHELTPTSLVNPATGCSSCRITAW